MKQYYYTNGADKFGPMSLEELKTKGITAETLVWYEGLDQWVKASTVPELASLFGANVPPPVQNATADFNSAPLIRPKTYLVESILVTLFCCMPFGIVGIVNAANVESRYNNGDYDGALRASNEAGKWTKIGFWIGLVGGILYFIFMMTGAVTGVLD